MNKIQVLVDDNLYKLMIDCRMKHGLRLSLIKSLKLSKEKMNGLDEALMDIQNGDVEYFTSDEFDKQINDLRN